MTWLSVSVVLPATAAADGLTFSVRPELRAALRTLNRHMPQIVHIALRFYRSPMIVSQNRRDSTGKHS